MFEHIDKPALRRAYVRFRNTAIYTFLAYVAVYVLSQLAGADSFAQMKDILTSEEIWFNIVQALIASVLSGSLYGAKKLKDGVKYNQVRSLTAEG